MPPGDDLIEFSAEYQDKGKIRMRNIYVGGTHSQYCSLIRNIRSILNNISFKSLDKIESENILQHNSV